MKQDAMNSNESINTKHLLFTTFLAFLSALVLCWFKSGALMQSNDWRRWKKVNLVACGPIAANTDDHSNDDKQVPEKNNGCSHQLPGTLCHTSTKRKKMNTLI